MLFTYLTFERRFKHYLDFVNFKKKLNICFEGWDYDQREKEFQKHVTNSENDAF